MAGPIAAAQAASAYRATQQVAATGGEDAGGFSATLRRAVEGAVATGQAADTASSQALLGNGSITDVVMAVSRAEMALQTAVAVRDRVVSAYQDVMRMPI